MTQPAQAAFIATTQEVDGNVVVTGGGSLNLTDLIFVSSQNNAPTLIYNKQRFGSILLLETILFSFQCPVRRHLDPETNMSIRQSVPETS